MDDDFYRSMAASAETDSDGGIIKSLQSIDDMDDNLFGNMIKRKPSARLAANMSSPSVAAKGPSSLAAPKFHDWDEDDPLAGILSDDDSPNKRQPRGRGATTSMEPSPVKSEPPHRAGGLQPDHLEGRRRGVGVTFSESVDVLDGALSAQSLRKSDMKHDTSVPLGSAGVHPSGADSLQFSAYVPSAASTPPSTGQGRPRATDDWLGLGPEVAVPSGSILTSGFDTKPRTPPTVKSDDNPTPQPSSRRQRMADGQNPSLDAQWLSSSAVTSSQAVSGPSSDIVAPSSRSMPDWLGSASVAQRPPSPRVDSHARQVMMPVSSTNVSADSNAQARILMLEKEKENLEKMSKWQTEQHQAELESLKMLNKQHVDMLESMHQQREKLLSDEVAALTGRITDERKVWENEQKKTVEANETRLTQLEDRHQQEILRLKSEHQNTLDLFKEMHEREKQNSSFDRSHITALEKLMQRLDVDSTGLINLHEKVSGLIEKGQENLSQTSLAGMMTLQTQLEKERGEWEKECTRMKNEKEKIELQWRDEKNKLEAEGRLLVEQRHSVELERQTVQADKARVHSERQTLTEEKTNFAQDKTDMKSLKLELERQTDMLHSKQLQLSAWEHELQTEVESLAAERTTCKQIMDQLEEERARLKATARTLAARMQEVEALCFTADESKDEGLRALKESRRLEASLRQTQDALEQKQEEVGASARQLDVELAIVEAEKHKLQAMRASQTCSHCLRTLHPPVGGGDETIMQFSANLSTFIAGSSEEAEFLENERLFLAKLKALT